MYKYNFHNNILYWYKRSGNIELSVNMTVKGLCCVFMFGLVITDGQLLTLRKIDLMHTLAKDLGSECITVIMEKDVLGGINEKRMLMKGYIPTVLLDLNNSEALVNITKKNKNKCLSFTIISEDLIQSFLTKITKTDKKILRDTTWFLWINNNQFELDPTLIEFNSDVNILVENIDESTDVKEIYSLGFEKNRRVFENQYGVFNIGVGLVLNSFNKWERRRTLHGITLNTILMQEEGYLYFNRNSSYISKRNIKKIPWSGIFPDIFESLAETLNFSFALIHSRDGNWGSYDQATKSWNGAVKDLIEGVADVSPSSFSLTQIRSTVIEFSLPILSAETVFLVSAKPSFSWDIFSRPFNFYTWTVLYITIIVMSCFLALLTRWGRETHLKEFDLIKSFIFVYRAFSGLSARRWSITPKNSSGR